MSVRSYSIVFTLVVLVLILDGFHAKLMANPVSTEELFDLGGSNFILKYGLDSFLWLILITAQYLWCHYIYWRLVGNPYFNFLDVCSMSTISVFITTSDAHPLESPLKRRGTRVVVRSDSGFPRNAFAIACSMF
jgi:meckelin